MYFVSYFHHCVSCSSCIRRSVSLSPWLQKHIINEWKETGAEFHDGLIDAYCEEITPMLANYIQSLPEGTLLTPQ